MTFSRTDLNFLVSEVILRSAKFLKMRNDMFIFVFYLYFKKYFIFHHHGYTGNINFT